MKRNLPAIVGALLFAATFAVTEIHGLRSLIDQGYTHWKFGAEDYYTMSIWLMRWVVALLAVMFFAVTSVTLRLAPKIPWYASILAGVILGVAAGLQTVRVHQGDLHLSKSEPHVDSVRLK